MYHSIIYDRSISVIHHRSILVIYDKGIRICWGKSNTKIDKFISHYFSRTSEVLAMRTIYNDDRDKNHKGHITVVVI